MKRLHLVGIVAASALLLAGCDQLRSITGMSSDGNASTNAAAPAAPAPAPAPAPALSTPSAGPNASVSGSAQQNFTVVNSTSKTVLTLHVSAVTDENWGPDILGASVIQAGATANVTFPRTESQCNWDIRAVYTDGDDTEMRGVNLCQVATVTLTEN